MISMSKQHRQLHCEEGTTDEEVRKARPDTSTAQKVRPVKRGRHPQKGGTTGTEHEEGATG